MSKTIQMAEAALAEAQQKLDALHVETLELAARLAELGAPDDPTADAEALLAGQSLNGSKSREEAAVVERRLAAVEAALPIQQDRVTTARHALDDAILEQAVIDARSKAQKLAEALVAVGDAADELHATLADVDLRGIPRLHRLPGLALSPLRSSLPESRINTFIDELERDYGVKVKRPALEAERERRYKAHMADQERYRKAGAVVAAGPDGVKEYEPGGRVKPPPPRGRRAGRDDFWSRR